MQGITLETILSEIKRIELVHAGEFKSIREELGGVKADVSELKADMVGVKGELVKMNTRLGRVEENVDVIREQTAILTEGHMDHERRLRKLEGAGPSV